MMCVDSNQDGKVDFHEFTDRFHNPAKDIGFNVAVLLTNLSEHMPGDSRWDWDGATDRPTLVFGVMGVLWLNWDQEDWVFQTEALTGRSWSWVYCSEGAYRVMGV